MAKRVIRKECNETNSSSQHCILVTKNDVHIKPEEFSSASSDDYSECLWLNDGQWHLRGIEDYGRWPFMILTTFEEKFKYALCDFLGYRFPDDPEYEKIYYEFQDLAKEIVPGLRSIECYRTEFDIYLDEDENEVLRKDLEYAGNDEYVYVGKDGKKHKAILDTENYIDAPEIGHIDHQSAGVLTNFLKDKGISLKEFLTNKKYAVVIDSDESCDFERYQKSGLIDMNFITEIYDKSGEDVEWEEWKKENENGSDTI